MKIIKKSFLSFLVICLALSNMTPGLSYAEDATSASEEISSTDETGSMEISTTRTDSTAESSEADTAELYTVDTDSSADNSEADTTEDTGNWSAAAGVTKEMGSASYWTAKSVIGASRVLATVDDINAYNKSSFDSSGTSVMGIETYGLQSDGTDTCVTKSRIESVPTRTLYIDGVQIDNTEYFGNIRTQYTETAIAAGTTIDNRFGICVKETALKSWPTNDIIGYSAADPDDEMDSSSLLVGEPLLIQQECSIDGTLWYWGYTDNFWGWVCSDDIALCHSRSEWTSEWNFDRSSKDILVITQDKIVLEPSVSNSYSSKVQLDMGCVLKLVPESEWTDAISQLAERGTWNNYVVYLPTKGDDGYLIDKPALISEHYSVSVGYPALTEANVLKIAFSCLGNRYGWGGMLESLDCTHFTRNLYRCFGYLLPTNSTKQPKVVGYTTDVSSMTDDEKAAFLATLPLGSLLYFSGHAMVYVGCVDGVPYCISATGSLSDSEGDLNVESQYSVILNPLTVRRASGKTWLNNITSVVTFSSLRHTEHEYGEWTVTKDPTCTKDGLQVRTCDLCGATEEETIRATGHTFGEYEVLADATCTKAGVKEATCTICGAVVKETIPATGHTFGKYEVLADATCTKTGVKEAACTVCGAVVKKTISATGHTVVKDKAVAATIYSAGKTAGKHCSVCGKVLTAQKTVKKLTPTIKLSTKKKTLKKGKYFTLKITYKKGDCVKIKNNSKASVASCKKIAAGKYKITAKKKGTTVITFTLKSWKKASVKVVVK